MKIGSTKEIFSGKWLVANETTYFDKTGKERTYEFVERKNESQVVTVICKSTRSGKILLVSQPRVPIEAIEVAFPAGLVEKGESIEKAALRELQEETGYKAKVISISDPLPKSAGLTNELSSLVYCETDESDREKPNMDETEEIVSMWVRPSEFKKLVKDCKANNVKIAHGLYCFMMGVQFSDYSPG
ncbi:MAG: NUDIX domain-containing protein [Candidatus Hodarchaeales archaeon]|jgi:ADP-ribose pyrophosphatase